MLIQIERRATCLIETVALFKKVKFTPFSVGSLIAKGLLIPNVLMSSLMFADMANGRSIP